MLNYYGRFYRSELYPLLRRVNVYLVRRMRKKYRRLRTLTEGAHGLEAHDPPVPALLRAFGHGARSSDGEVEKSPVTGDGHAGICGSPEVRSLWATQPPAAHANYPANTGGWRRLSAVGASCRCCVRRVRVPGSCWLMKVRVACRARCTGQLPRRKN